MKHTKNNGVELCVIRAEDAFSSEHIDYFIPQAYARQPLPLQEARTFCSTYSDIDVDSNVMWPNERRQSSFHKEKNNNKKEILLGELLGQARSLEELSFSSEPPVENTVVSRIRGTHCDASNVPSPQLMLELVLAIFLRGTGTEVEDTHSRCISSIDISGTLLGLAGACGPSFPVDVDGSPFPDFGNVMFFSDKKVQKRKKLTACTFAFACVAPLLWVPGNGRFRVTSFTCRHCCFSDRDAKALAFILRQRMSSFHLCVLENIDLSFNNITDDGADALKRAIKYNRHVKTLLLLGNNKIRNTNILRKIEDRLQKNKRKEEYLNCWLRLKWTLKGH